MGAHRSLEELDFRGNLLPFSKNENDALRVLLFPETAHNVRLAADRLIRWKCPNGVIFDDVPYPQCPHLARDFNCLQPAPQSFLFNRPLRSNHTQSSTRVLKRINSQTDNLSSTSYQPPVNFLSFLRQSNASNDSSQFDPWLSFSDLMSQKSGVTNYLPLAHQLNQVLPARPTNIRFCRLRWLNGDPITLAICQSVLASARKKLNSKSGSSQQFLGYLPPLATSDSLEESASTILHAIQDVINHRKRIGEDSQKDVLDEALSIVSKRIQEKQDLVMFVGGDSFKNGQVSSKVGGKLYSSKYSHSEASRRLNELTEITDKFNRQQEILSNSRSLPNDDHIDDQTLNASKKHQADKVSALNRNELLVTEYSGDQDEAEKAIGILKYTDLIEGNNSERFTNSTEFHQSRPRKARFSVSAASMRLKRERSDFRNSIRSEFGHDMNATIQLRYASDLQILKNCDESNTPMTCLNAEEIKQSRREIHGNTSLVAAKDSSQDIPGTTNYKNNSFKKYKYFSPAFKIFSERERTYKNVKTKQNQSGSFYTQDDNISESSEDDNYLSVVLSKGADAVVNKKGPNKKFEISDITMIRTLLQGSKDDHEIDPHSAVRLKADRVDTVYAAEEFIGWLTERRGKYQAAVNALRTKGFQVKSLIDNDKLSEGEVSDQFGVENAFEETQLLETFARWRRETETKEQKCKDVALGFTSIQSPIINELKSPLVNRFKEELNFARKKEDVFGSRKDPNATINSLQLSSSKKKNLKVQDSILLELQDINNQNSGVNNVNNSPVKRQFEAHWNLSPTSVLTLPIKTNAPELNSRDTIESVIQKVKSIKEIQSPISRGQFRSSTGVERALGRLESQKLLKDLHLSRNSTTGKNNYAFQNINGNLSSSDGDVLSATKAYSLNSSANLKNINTESRRAITFASNDLMIISKAFTNDGVSISNVKETAEGEDVEDKQYDEIAGALPLNNPQQRIINPNDNDEFTTELNSSFSNQMLLSAQSSTKMATTLGVSSKLSPSTIPIAKPQKSNSFTSNFISTSATPSQHIPSGRSLHNEVLSSASESVGSRESDCSDVESAYPLPSTEDPSLNPKKTREILKMRIKWKNHISERRNRDLPVSRRRIAYMMASREPVLGVSTNIAGVNVDILTPEVIRLKNIVKQCENSDMSLSTNRGSTESSKSVPSKNRNRWNDLVVSLAPSTESEVCDVLLNHSRIAIPLTIQSRLLSDHASFLSHQRKPKHKTLDTNSSQILSLKKTSQGVESSDFEDDTLDDHKNKSEANNTPSQRTEYPLLLKDGTCGVVSFSQVVEHIYKKSPSKNNNNNDKLSKSDAVSIKMNSELSPPTSWISNFPIPFSNPFDFENVNNDFKPSAALLSAATDDPKLLDVAKAADLIRKVDSHEVSEITRTNSERQKLIQKANRAESTKLFSESPSNCVVSIADDEDLLDENINETYKSPIDIIDPDKTVISTSLIQKEKKMDLEEELTANDAALRSIVNVSRSLARVKRILSRPPGTVDAAELEESKKRAQQEQQMTIIEQLRIRKEETKHFLESEGCADGNLFADEVLFPRGRGVFITGSKNSASLLPFRNRNAYSTSDTMDVESVRLGKFLQPRLDPVNPNKELPGRVENPISLDSCSAEQAGHLASSDPTCLLQASSYNDSKALVERLKEHQEIKSQQYTVREVLRELWNESDAQLSKKLKDAAAGALQRGGVWGLRVGMDMDKNPAWVARSDAEAIAVLLGSDITQSSDGHDKYYSRLFPSSGGSHSMANNNSGRAVRDRRENLQKALTKTRGSKEYEDAVKSLLKIKSKESQRIKFLQTEPIDDETPDFIRLGGKTRSQLNTEKSLSEDASSFSYLNPKLAQSTSESRLASSSLRNNIETSPENVSESFKVTPNVYDGKSRLINGQDLIVEDEIHQEDTRKSVESRSRRDSINHLKKVCSDQAVDSRLAATSASVAALKRSRSFKSIMANDVSTRSYSLRDLAPESEFETNEHSTNQLHSTTSPTLITPLINHIGHAPTLQRNLFSSAVNNVTGGSVIVDSNGTTDNLKTSGAKKGVKKGASASKEVAMEASLFERCRAAWQVIVDQKEKNSLAFETDHVFAFAEKKKAVLGVIDSFAQILPGRRCLVNSSSKKSHNSSHRAIERVEVEGSRDSDGLSTRRPGNLMYMCPLPDNSDSQWAEEQALSEQRLVNSLIQLMKKDSRTESDGPYATATEFELYLKSTCSLPSLPDAVDDAPRRSERDMIIRLAKSCNSLQELYLTARVLLEESKLASSFLFEELRQKRATAVSFATSSKNGLSQDRNANSNNNSGGDVAEESVSSAFMHPAIDLLGGYYHSALSFLQQHFKLYGAVDEAAIKRALSKVVARRNEHEISFQKKLETDEDIRLSSTTKGVPKILSGAYTSDTNNSSPSLLRHNLLESILQHMMNNGPHHALPANIVKLQSEIGFGTTAAYYENALTKDAKLPPSNISPAPKHNIASTESPPSKSYLSPVNSVQFIDATSHKKTSPRVTQDAAALTKLNFEEKVAFSPTVLRSRSPSLAVSSTASNRDTPLIKQHFDAHIGDSDELVTFNDQNFNVNHSNLTPFSTSSNSANIDSRRSQTLSPFQKQSPRLRDSELNLAIDNLLPVSNEKDYHYLDRYHTPSLMKKVHLSGNNQNKQKDEKSIKELMSEVKNSAGSPAFSALYLPEPSVSSKRKAAKSIFKNMSRELFNKNPNSLFVSPQKFRSSINQLPRSDTIQSLSTDPIATLGMSLHTTARSSQQVYAKPKRPSSASHLQRCQSLLFESPKTSAEKSVMNELDPSKLRRIFFLSSEAKDAILTKTSSSQIAETADTTSKARPKSASGKFRDVIQLNRRHPEFVACESKKSLSQTLSTAF